MERGVVSRCHMASLLSAPLTKIKSVTGSEEEQKMIKKMLNIPFLMAVLLVLALPLSAQAEPRFSAHTGQYCSSCHINPTGGGPRSPNGKIYASQYFQPVSIVEHEEALYDDADPMKNWDFQIDTRFLTLAAEKGVATFFPMQTSFYGILHLQPGNKGKASFILNLNKPGRNSTFGVEEAYAFYSRSNGLYVKAGKFDITYGLNHPEHTTYVRRNLGFDFNSQDTGVEIGMVNEQKWFSHLALTNGNMQTGLNTDLFDTNDQKAVLFKLGGWDKLWHGFGGLNIYSSKNSLNTITRYGGYGGGSIGKKSQLLGEVDYGTNKTLSTGAKTNLLASYLELTHRFSKRLHLTTSFEYFDPDTDVKKTALKRISVTPRFNMNTFSSLSLTFEKNFEIPEVANDFVYAVYYLWY